jgi:hypothetical protein
VTLQFLRLLRLFAANDSAGEFLNRCRCHRHGTTVKLIVNGCERVPLLFFAV